MSQITIPTYIIGSRMMQEYNYHWPSGHLSIPITLKFTGPTQWVISDYPMTKLDTELYLTFLKSRLERQVEEMREYGEEAFADMNTNIKPIPTIRNPIWGREQHRGAANSQYYMPVTLSDIKIIKETLKQERIANGAAN